MIKENKICAVVITYNPNIELLTNEYNSVISQVDSIYYVDNNSSNKDVLKEWSGQKDSTYFIWLNTNEGIGKAQNCGIRKAIIDGASHVLILDQDTVLSADFVNCLLNTEKKAICEGHNVGITAPVFLSVEDNYAYPIPTICNNKVVRIPISNINKYIEVSHVIASGQLIRAEVFGKVGLMREDLFIGYVDFEYCFRARKKGFSIIVSNEAIMHHTIGDRQILLCKRKIGLYSPFRRYFDCRNTLLIQKDKSFPPTLAKYYLKLLPMKILVSIIGGPNRLKQIRYIVKGIYDGLRGISGYCTI